MEDVPDFSPYPAAPEPDYYAEPEKPRSRRMWYLLGGGAALLACCALVGILLIVSALNGNSSFSLSLFSTDTPTPTATATHTPTPTITPTPPPTNTPVPPPTQPPAVPTSTTSSGPALTGSQTLTDTEFFDDFSSDALGWAVNTTDNTSVGYEGEGYSINIITPGYVQVVEPPVEALNHLEFNADVISGRGNGAFGIACYYVDIDNFTYMVFDSDSQNVLFAEYVNNEYKQLSDWIGHSQPVSGARFSGDCTAGGMVAYVNNTPVAQISVNKPDGPFKMWLFAITWNDSGGRMKVLFDNASGYLAQQ
jgi:hypothetical protein